MIPPGYRTKAELSLAHLEALKRPLTDEESEQLRRSLHAVYCRNRRARLEREQAEPALIEYRNQEAETLAKVLREAGR